MVLQIIAVHTESLIESVAELYLSHNVFSYL